MAPSLSLQALVERWSHARVGERANAQSYVIELCQALGVEPPRPAGGGYEFEFPVRVVNRDGSETTNFLDLYKRHHLALEAKDYEAGTASDMLLRKAFGQVRSYVGHLPDERPPYLLVLDVGKTLLVWDRWSGDYGGFNAARRIDLTQLPSRPDDAALLRDVFENPGARDPRSKAIAVTKDIAARLAELATRLEGQGYGQEQVARFLMRCVFTMFAEDTSLLPGEPFRRIIEDVALADPAEFVPLAEELWRAMDQGTRFNLRRLLRFNGHVFREAEALPLDREALVFLLAASRADWRRVEPSIFGTLLTRALDPVERHRLGAEFTPREFVERVVRPAVEEPLRERWTAVQAEVLLLRAAGKKTDRAAAERRLREFHDWLKGLRFLDPACGSGNFLYVTLNLVKQLELEVLRELEGLTGEHEIRLEEVGPWQFYGIEVKPWAREIAELVLWIGFHQFWAAHHDVQPPEPVLRDTGTLECRDAVLTWDEVRHDPERDRSDPMPRIVSPVTGELIPDPDAKLPYMEYVNARPAPWPEADFIIGNPPYLGKGRQRELLGDGYVDALRATYSAVPDGADYVMYWWHRAAAEVAEGRAIRAGLITTNSITQSQSRGVVRDAIERGAAVAWAIPDHPWVQDEDGAAVRIAMTTIAPASAQGGATLVTVDECGAITAERHVARLNTDLTADADVASASAVWLHANAVICANGFMLAGRGFVLTSEEAAALLTADPRHAEIIKPLRNGKDLTDRPRGVYVIDFGVRTEEEAREYPVLFDLVRSRVKPERDANPDPARRTFWWRFARTSATLRDALAGLPRYIATAERTKHRMFVFLDRAVAPEHRLVCVASSDAFHLGVLSSALHVRWALAAGSKLEDRPGYHKVGCFDPFPFPDAEPALHATIAARAERLDTHRATALARDSRVTMTQMYNVLEKLRSGEALSRTEQHVHMIGACGVLKDLHDELDALVAQAYGWPWPIEQEEILERLVALHDERVEEEKRGLVRWLRPDYQAPRFGAVAQAEPEMELRPAKAPVPRARPEKLAWPEQVIDQIALLRTVLAAEPLTAKDLARRVRGAREDLLAQQLEILTIMGELRRDDEGRYHVATRLRPAA